MIRVDLGRNELQKKPGKNLKGVLARIRMPPQISARVKKYQLTAGLTSTVAVSLAVSALFPVFASQYQSTITSQHAEKMKAAHERLEAINQQVTRLSPFRRELQSYEDQKKVVTERLATVKQLLDQRGTPVNVLDTIGQSLPLRTWVSDLSLSIIEPFSVQLSGSSYSNEEVSDLLDNLTKSVYLNNVTLDEVGSKMDGNIELKSFQITARPKVKVEGPAAQIALVSPPPPPLPPSPASVPTTPPQGAPGGHP